MSMTASFWKLYRIRRLLTKSAAQAPGLETGSSHQNFARSQSAATRSHSLSFSGVARVAMDVRHGGERQPVWYLMLNLYDY